MRKSPLFNAAGLASPVDKVLELLEGDEDQHRGRLQPHPCRHPALEHKCRTLVLHRSPDDLKGRLRCNIQRMQNGTQEIEPTLDSEPDALMIRLCTLK